MNDQLNVDYYGTTVFQHSEHELNVSTWKIDHFVENTIADALQKSGKFHVVRGNTDATRQSLIDSTNIWTGTSLKPVEALAKETGANCVLMVSPVYQLRPAGDQQSGYGINQRSLFGSQSGTNYVAALVRLIDGGNGEQIAKKEIILTSQRPESSWLDEAAPTLNAENDKKTEQEIKQLLFDALHQAMDKLNITN